MFLAVKFKVLILLILSILTNISAEIEQMTVLHLTFNRTNLKYIKLIHRLGFFKLFKEMFQI